MVTTTAYDSPGLVLHQEHRRSVMVSPTSVVVNLCESGVPPPSGCTRVTFAARLISYRVRRPMNCHDELGSDRTDMRSRTILVLTCEPERFLVRINFTQPFRGVVHAGDKRDNCRIRGNGSHFYTLPVPLNDCSTAHNDATGSFTNSLTIRFHPSLELEGDEIKTLVCKFTTGDVSLG
ncbi:hypothetical protein HPB51_021877 [Rhipicephalus microplus]|uniref:ZP domain-containing protein n=1 Tax=Rhipicephalus microplus TaxID=6941 RepID=A0A9J6EIU5_RHIMP|nr:hypothetical protein HPB51_021877 [Rhipicephalus microplus]